MRILVIGGTGTIGSAVVRALAERHDVIAASRSGAAEAVDITDSDSIRALYRRIGPLDAIVSAAGGAAWKPLLSLDESDFAVSIGDKLMGQVNVVRLALALEVVRDGGSITVTSGILAQQPSAGSAAVSLVNAGLEGFARAAALEASRGVRVNVVSPGWVSETLASMGRDPAEGTPAAEVASAYVSAVEGSASGEILPARRR